MRTLSGLGCWFGAGAVGLVACTTEPCSVTPCDVGQVDCQERLAQTAACLRGVPAHSVPVRFISRNAYADAVKSEATKAERERYAELARAYTLLGLEPKHDYDDLAQGYAASVGAYYDTEAKRITLFDDMRSWDYALADRALVHEFIHVLQQDVAPEAPQVSTLDEFLALSAVREGDAVVHADKAALLFFGGSPQDPNWPELFGKWAARTDTAYEEEALRVGLASRYFPYPYGSLAVYARLEARGTAGVDAWLRRPPRSTRELLGLGKPGALGNPAFPLDVELPPEEAPAPEDAGAGDAAARDAGQPPGLGADAGNRDTADASDAGDAGNAADATLGIPAAILDEDDDSVLVPDLRQQELLSVDALGYYVVSRFLSVVQQACEMERGPGDCEQEVEPSLQHDHLSVWRAPDTGDLTAVWRLSFTRGASSIFPALELWGARSGQAATTLRSQEEVLIVASEAGKPAPSDIATWQWRAVSPRALAQSDTSQAPRTAARSCE